MPFSEASHHGPRLDTSTSGRVTSTRFWGSLVVSVSASLPGDSQIFSREYLIGLGCAAESIKALLSLDALSSRMNSDNAGRRITKELLRTTALTPPKGPAETLFRPGSFPPHPNPPYEIVSGALASGTSVGFEVTSGRFSILRPPYIFCVVRPNASKREQHGKVPLSGVHSEAAFRKNQLMRSFGRYYLTKLRTAVLICTKVLADRSPQPIFWVPSSYVCPPHF